MASTIISRDTKDAILAMIEAQVTEPVTVSEVYVAQKRHLKKSFSTVAKALQELTDEGRLITRPELPSERLDKMRGGPAVMHWPASMGERIPVRTTDSQLTGVTRLGSIGVRTAAHRPKKKARPGKQLKLQTGSSMAKVSRPGKASELQTGNRIERLEKRVMELEATLASLRKILH